MPEIKKWPKQRVAYVENVGPYSEATQSGFRRLFAWFVSKNIQPMGPSLTILLDDPAKVPQKQLRSESCAPVAASVKGSDQVMTKEIGGFQAATIIYRGEQNSDSAYREVYNGLHAQGYHESGSPVETYLSQLGEELRSEIAVPVEKAAAPLKAPRAAGKSKKPAKKVKAKTAPKAKRSAKKAKKK